MLRLSFEFLFFNKLKWQSEEYHSIFGIGDPLPSHFICSDEKRNDIYKIADYFYMVYDYDHLIVFYGYYLQITVSVWPSLICIGMIIILLPKYSWFKLNWIEAGFKASMEISLLSLEIWFFVVHFQVPWSWAVLNFLISNLQFFLSKDSKIILSLQGFSLGPLVLHSKELGPSHLQNDHGTLVLHERVTEVPGSYMKLLIIFL